jgi:hypothetical protein
MLASEMVENGFASLIESSISSLLESGSFMRTTVDRDVSRAVLFSHAQAGVVDTVVGRATCPEDQPAPDTNGCIRREVISGRRGASRCRHMFKKVMSSIDESGGYSGSASVHAI